MSRPLVIRFGFFWSHTSVRSQQDPIQAYQLNGCGICGGPSYSQNTVNINVQRKFRPMKGNPRQSWIFNFTPRIPDSCRLFISVFVSELGFWIPTVSGIPDSLSCIPDSKAQEIGFHKQKFPCTFAEFGLPYIRRKVQIVMPHKRQPRTTGVYQ